MALQTGRSSSIPEGAIKLSRQEALEHQRNIIRDWHSESDVLFIRYGRHISALTNIATSYTIVDFLKSHLGINRGSLLLTFIPAIAFPAIVSYISTEKVLTNNILLMKMDCPLCHQLKFAVSQFYTGIIFPTVFGYFSYASIAMGSKSCAIPLINKDAKAFWKFTFNILKKGTKQFQICGIVHSIVVLSLPFLQNKQLLNVLEILEQQEKEIEFEEENISKLTLSS